MAFSSPVYSPSSTRHGDEQVYDNELLAIMSPELLGSAPLPSMDPEEHQKYIDGITLKAKVNSDVYLSSLRAD